MGIGDADREDLAHELACRSLALASDRRYSVSATKWLLLGIQLVVALFFGGVLIWNVYINAIAG